MSRDRLKNAMICLVYYITKLLVFDDPKFQEFLLNTFQCRNVGVKSVGTKVDARSIQNTFYKCFFQLHFFSKSSFFFVHTSSCNFTDDVWTKKKFLFISYKLVQISPIMILVNSGAFLSISSWFSELTELIFVMIPYISSTGYPPTTQGIMGHCK